MNLSIRLGVQVLPYGETTLGVVTLYYVFDGTTTNSRIPFPPPTDRIASPRFRLHQGKNSHRSRCITCIQIRRASPLRCVSALLREYRRPHRSLR